MMKRKRRWATRKEYSSQEGGQGRFDEEANIMRKVPSCTGKCNIDNLKGIAMPADSDEYRLKGYRTTA
jgi:hypothetical protein